ncbi:MAG TPA: fumarate hydratase, partial [Candidatus Paceibacterota bacterium]|nr:fumarate hydratase [Candidatus Paceibacterota bacterium]
MRTIVFEQISRTVESLCIAACHELPQDVVQALERAAQKESNPRAAGILRQLLENACIA